MKKSSQNKDVLVKLSASEQATLSSLLSLDFEKVITQGVYGFLAEGARILAKALMEAEVTSLCGERYERGSDKQAGRWGSEPGKFVVHGTKDVIEKPRVRNRLNGKEVGLETYAALNEQDSLNGKFLASILSGTSTRNYTKTVEAELRKMGVSKSSVSRGAIAATKPLVDAFLKRDLAPLNLVALFIDGIHIGTKQVLVCIGVGAGGKKYVIGLKPGASENEIVCRDLLRDLKERGLKVDRRYLFVVDGAKALAAAIRAAFGNDTAIQRCIEHKIRDIEAYLPFKERASIRGKLRAAWNQKTEKAAQKRLSEIRSKLTLISEAAANSLTEGMLDTLTLHRLGVTGELRESLRTTNVIESAFSAARRLTAKTTRYRDEQAVIMWLARGLQESEKNFRPVRGYRQLTSLSSKLNPAKE
jgi:transposase-like protein